MAPNDEYNEDEYNERIAALNDIIDAELDEAEDEASADLDDNGELDSE